MSRVNRYGSKRKKWKRIVLITGTLAAIYAGGMAFFHTHYYPNTQVGNIEIGLKSREKARDYVKDELEKYTLSILEKDGNESLTANQAGLSFSDLNKVDEILDQQTIYYWPYQVTQNYNYDKLTIQVDQDILSTSVDQLHCMNPAKPEESVSASIKYDKKKKKFKIVPETVGNIVEKQRFIQGLTEKLKAHEPSISLVEDTYYVQPVYKSDSEEVIKANKVMNKYLDGIVTYKDGGLKTKTYRKDIADMLVCSPKFNVKIDKKKVKSFVRKTVADKFNSLDGNIPSGITAWKVSVDRETDKLIKNIRSGKRTTRKPVYSQEGFDRGGYDIGKTYIDVNISDQCMWYVENGKVRLSSDVVTGNVSTGHASSTGFYRIAYKQRDHLMVKYNSFVHYWMPYNTTVGVGFHDANWRGAFGGQIYRYNGSHGCINMPPSKAAQLYGMVSAGTAVYVHW